MEKRDVVSRHKEFLFPCVATYFPEPLVIARGEGSRVWDDRGRDYLDFFGGILTVSLGHCHPEVTDRVVEQARTLQHTSTLYVNQPMVDLAERLARLAPGRLQKSFFTNSGTEADETALLLARMHTGASEVIALRYGYSGRSLLAVNLTGHAAWRLVPSMVPGIKHAVSPYCYRCPFGLEYPSCGVRCAKDLDELIRTETTGRPAAFLAEPIQGVGGFIVPPPEYFQIAVEIVRKYGGLFVSDEVQTGFGRTGDKWFGIEHFGVEPDILTFAKGAANGLPIGGTIARPEVADAWTGPTISTFGGNPVSSVAALATLDVMEREDVPGRAARLGARLRGHLVELAERFPAVGDVRGMGLMQAVELVKDRGTKEPDAALANRVLEESRRRGLLVGKGGHYGNTLRISPPMLISAAEVDEAGRTLHEAFAAAVA